jgi:Pyrimidine dimer DNA glycosylase
MNIFYLDNDPIVAAQMQCDKHVVKMCLETAQILCTVRARYGLEAPYKPTHKNHPAVLWAGGSIGNYLWTLTHFKGLLSEYEFRYKRQHKSGTVCLQIVSTPPEGINRGKLTAPARCMDTGSRSVSTDAVECYRHYYKTQKASILKYSVRHAPTWLI